MSDLPLNFYRRTSDKLPLLPHPHDDSEPCPGGCNDILVVEEAISNVKNDIAALDTRIKEAHEQTIILKTLVGQASEQMIRVMAAVATTNTTLEKNTSETSEILDILRQGKTFFKLSQHLGEAIRWGIGIAVSLASAYLTIRNWPK